ncbi:putative O-antigen translocase [Vibrio chagasii]|nr:putative O-antigen translocase [Vibrio chagasii]
MVKSSLYILVLQASRILIGLFLMKLVSVSVGPKGLAFLGNYLSFLTIIVALSGGGIINGVAKYVAQYKANDKLKKEFLISSLYFSVIFSFLFTVVLLLFSRDITVFIFGSLDYKIIIYFLIILQAALSLIYIVSSFYNGMGESENYAKIIILGNFIALPFIYYLVVSGDYILIALAFMAPYFFCIVPVFFKLKFVFPGGFFISYKVLSSHFKNLSSFSLMALVSSIMYPITEIIIRGFIFNEVGIVEVGYWQALIKLSTVYLAVFSVFLSAHYMPIIASCNDKKTIDRNLQKYIIILGSVFVLGGGVYFFLRNDIIPLVFSNEFIAISDLVKYQLLGDFFRVLSMVVMFVFVAKAKTKEYVIFDIIQYSALIVLSWALLAKGGTLEMFYVAYLIVYVSYFLMVLSYYTFYLKRDKNAISC